MLACTSNILRCDGPQWPTQVRRSPPRHFFCCIKIIQLTIYFLFLSKLKLRFNFSLWSSLLAECIFLVNIIIHICKNSILYKIMILFLIIYLFIYLRIHLIYVFFFFKYSEQIIIILVLLEIFFFILFIKLNRSQLSTMLGFTNI